METPIGINSAFQADLRRFYEYAVERSGTKFFALKVTQKTYDQYKVDIDYFVEVNDGVELELC